MSAKPGVGVPLSRAAALEIQRATHAELVKGVDRAYKFEYASPVEGQEDFFILARPSDIIVSQKVVVRMNAAQALAFASQICSALAMSIVQGAAAPQD